jgi:hypothetical protein
MTFALVCSPEARGNSGLPSVTLAWNENPEEEVAGYKIYWGEVSRQYTEVMDVQDVPSAVLTGLEAGKTYHCAVTAYDGELQESAFSQEIVVSIGGTGPGTPGSTGGRLVRYEAESGQLGAPMVVFNGPSESWVDTSSYSQLGWTRSTFEIEQAGDYQIWCRVKAPTEGTDSFFVMMDDQAEEVFHIYGTPTPPPGTRTSDWTWQRIHVTDAGPRVHSLDEGSHSFRFRVREPGTLLDRVVLSSDPAFVPTDDLPRTGDAVVVTRPPSSDSVVAGQSAGFTVAAAASGPVSYQWRKNGTVIPGATSPVLTLDPVQTADAGSYTVTVVSGGATSTAGPALLTVSPAPGEPTFRVDRITLNPDGSVDFNLEGELNANILVYASGDLVDWTLIGERVNETGTIRMADPAAEGSPRRFYRLVSEAIPEE